MAIEVLVKDPRQTGIETVVRVAAEGTDRIVREHARNRLQQDVRKIDSPVVTEYVLTRLEQQVDQSGQPSAFLLGILGKCLSGLSAGGQGLPPDIARRALALLWYLLTRVRLADECIDPLLDALAFREFGQAAGELERWLNTIKDEPTQVHILDTLIAMDAPSLPDVVFQWAASDPVTGAAGAGERVSRQERQYHCLGPVSELAQGHCLSDRDSERHPVSAERITPPSHLGEWQRSHPAANP